MNHLGLVVLLVACLPADVLSVNAVTSAGARLQALAAAAAAAREPRPSTGGDNQTGGADVLGQSPDSGAGAEVLPPRGPAGLRAAALADRQTPSVGESANATVALAQAFAPSEGGPSSPLSRGKRGAAAPVKQAGGGDPAHLALPAARISFASLSEVGSHKPGGHQGWIVGGIAILAVPVLLLAGCLSIANQVNAPSLVAGAVAMAIGGLSGANRSDRPQPAADSSGRAPPTASGAQGRSRPAGAAADPAAQAAPHPRQPTRNLQSAGVAASPEATQYRQWADPRLPQRKGSTASRLPQKHAVDGTPLFGSPGASTPVLVGTSQSTLKRFVGVQGTCSSAAAPQAAPMALAPPVST